MRQKSLLMIVVLVLIFAMLSVAFIACDKKTDPTPDVDPGTNPEVNPNPNPNPNSDPNQNPDPGPQRTPAEISEAAITNFFTKLYAGNFVIDSAKGKTTVYSKDEVYFEYADDYTDPGIAYMTINEDETFQAVYTGTLSDIQFVRDEANALETAAELTPIYWKEALVENNNIWEIIYNDPENPLKFSSHDDNLKAQVLTMNGYVRNLGEFMGDVYLELNAENPTEAHIKATFSGGMPVPDPIDIVITFGNAKKSEAIEEWIANPQLPDAKTAWDEEDEFIFKSMIFDSNVIPFPEGASYALYYPNSFEEMFYYLDYVRIRDGQANQAMVDSYKAQLTSAGFETETKNGVTIYSKETSDVYHRSVHVEVRYNNGLEIDIWNYYNLSEFHDFNVVKAMVTDKGYPNLVVLPTTMSLVSAVEYYPQEIESKWYFFNYDIYLEVRLSYTDEAVAKDYMDAYTAQLTAAPRNYKYIEEEDIYQSTDDSATKRSSSFRWKFDGDEVVMLFKSEAYVTPQTVRSYIAADSGFPDPEFGAYANILETKYDRCRDIAAYTELMVGSKYDHIYTIWLNFDSYDEIDEYLHAYIDTFDDTYWKGGTQSNEYVMYNEFDNLTVSFRVDGNQVCITYKPAEQGVYFLKVQEYQDEGGIIRFGETGYYKPGKQIYVGASVFEGYVFAGWYEKTTSEPVLLTMEQEFFYEMPDDTSATLIAKWYKDGEA